MIKTIGAVISGAILVSLGCSNWQHWQDYLMAIATVFIAITGYWNFKVSKRLEGIEKQNAKYHAAAFQAEFRPYIFIRLKPGLNEDLQRDEIGAYFTFTNQDIFRLPFSLVNEGKIPAVNIEPKYDSYYSDPNENFVLIQENEVIEPVDTMGHLSLDRNPGMSMTYTPFIYISAIKNKEVKRLKVILKVNYKGNLKIDLNKYSTRVILIFNKQQEKNGMGTRYYIQYKTEEYD